MSRGRRRRPGGVRSGRPAAAIGEAIAALEAALAAERERRAAIERRVDEQATGLEALRVEFETARRRESLAADPEPEVAARGVARPGRLVELPREPGETGDSYWLRRCEGFTIEVGGESLGRVEAVRFERRHDRPDALIVSEGGRRRSLLVPVETVAQISPEQERVMLSLDPRERKPRHTARALADAFARRLHKLRPDGF
jgi:hypothetical protein